MWYLLIIKISLLIFAKNLYIPLMSAMFINHLVHGTKIKLLASQKLAGKVVA